MNVRQAGDDCGALMHVVRRLVLIGLVLVGSAAAIFPARAADPPPKVVPGLGCHGDKGQSQLVNTPSLGAQQSGYTLIQPYMFREGLRKFDVMNQMAKGLSDCDLHTLSDVIATSPKPVAEGSGDPARMQEAKKLVTKEHCDSCHNADFSAPTIFRVLPISGKTVWPRHCASTRAMRGRATMERWQKSCNLSLTLRLPSWRIAHWRYYPMPRNVASARSTSTSVSASNGR